MWQLGFKSLRNRRFTVALTVATLALSVALILGVERLRHAARENFAKSASGIDLIVAPRGNDVQILMSTIFGIGSSGPGMEFETFELVENLPQVAWAEPVLMGDNHRGFPVIGVTETYFDHYRHSGGRPLEFAQGGMFHSEGAIIGAEVATRFGYAPGTVIVNAHGSGEVSFDVHDEAPFTITGVLARTGTVADRMVYVSAEGFDRIHAEETQESDPFASREEESGHNAEHKDEGHNDHDHDDHAGEESHDDHADEHATHDHEDEGHDDHAQDGHASEESHDDHADEHAAHDHEDEGHDDHAHDDHAGHEADDEDGQGHSGHDHAHEPDKINAIYVGLKSRGSVLSVQRLLNEEKSEALSAVLPSVALVQLWALTGTAENALRLMGLAVAVVSLIGMTVMISSSLEARRREFAILRAVGATPGHIFGLILLEAALVLALGVMLGYVVLVAVAAGFDPILQARFGLQFRVVMPGSFDAILGCAILAAGLIASCLPAWRVYRMTLADGLSAKL